MTEIAEGLRLPVTPDRSLKTTFHPNKMNFQGQSEF